VATEPEASEKSTGELYLKKRERHWKYGGKKNMNTRPLLGRDNSKRGEKGRIIKWRERRPRHRQKSAEFWEKK